MAHFQMEKKADEHNPPSCVFTDETETKRSRTKSHTPDLEIFDDDIPTPSTSSLSHAVRKSVLNKTYVEYSSPEPPEPEHLLQTLTEKETESLLVVFPTVAAGLESLDAAKPLHNFSALTDKFHRVGYRYIDEIAQATPKELVEETGIFPPVAREIHKHSTGVTRQVKLEAVVAKNMLNEKGKEKELESEK